MSDRVEAGDAGAILQREGVAGFRDLPNGRIAISAGPTKQRPSEFAKMKWPRGRNIE
jgi:hypothetical protein